MSRELGWLLPHTLYEAVGFNLFDVMIFLQVDTIANHPVEVSPISTESITVWEKDECVLPANELTAHGEDGTIRVYRALFIEHVYSWLDSIEDNDVLSEDDRRGYIA